MTVATERAERAQVSCLHYARLTQSLVEARGGGNARLRLCHRAHLCRAAGEVLDDKPRYRPALRQVRI